MLLLIYENAIEALDKGIEILESGDLSELLFQRIDVQRKVLLIAEGLSVDEDPTAAHIMNICVFILDQISTESLENWKSWNVRDRSLSCRSEKKSSITWRAIGPDGDYKVLNSSNPAHIVRPAVRRTSVHAYIQTGDLPKNPTMDGNSRHRSYKTVKPHLICVI